MFKEIESYLEESGTDEDREIWPLFKPAITRKRSLKNIKDVEYKSRTHLRLVIALFISLINLIRARLSENRIGYFGAFSRVKQNKGAMYDDFLNENDLRKRVLFYHCSNFERVDLFVSLRYGVIFENLIAKAPVISNLLASGFIQCEISQGFKLRLNEEFSLTFDEIDLMIAQFSKRKQVYRNLINAFEFDTVEVVSAYTKPHVVSAANSLGVDTREYQHGLLFPYHPCYGYHTSKSVWTSTLLPKKLIIYSSYWLEKMRKSGYITSNSISLTTRVHKLTDESAPSDLATYDFSESIVFTGQGIEYERIAKLAKEFLEKQHQGNFIYRPHPREFTNCLQLANMVKSNRFRIVDESTFENTFYLIAKCKAHVSIYSSCHFDAIEILNKTYVFDVVDNNIIRHGGDDENIVYIRSADKLISSIYG